MRILRVRCGFQADHSSSSYLFYAVDRPVSAAGQAIANRFSSRAKVDKRYARYLKWGESSLSSTAYEALMNEHYDVMAEESYGWSTMMIAVPKNPEMKALLAPFADARGDNDQGVELQEFSKRPVVTSHSRRKAMRSPARTLDVPITAWATSRPMSPPNSGQMAPAVCRDSGLFGRAKEYAAPVRSRSASLLSLRHPYPCLRPARQAYKSAASVGSRGRFRSGLRIRQSFALALLSGAAAFSFPLSCSSNQSMASFWACGRALP